MGVVIGGCIGVDIGVYGVIVVVIFGVYLYCYWL